MRVDNEMREISEEIKLDKNKKHSIEVVIDRIIVKPGIEDALSDSIETALELGEGRIIVDIIGQEELFLANIIPVRFAVFPSASWSRDYFLLTVLLGLVRPATASAISWKSMWILVIPDWNLSLNENAIAPWTPETSQFYPQLLKSVCDHYGIDMDIPVKDIPKEMMDKILYGSGTEKIHFRYVSDVGQVREKDIYFEGVINNIARRYNETSSEYIRESLGKFMAEKKCGSCKGYRLKEEALAVLVNGLHISKVTEFSVTDAIEFFRGLKLTEKEQQISRMIIKEIKNRLEFLKNVGLDYLDLARAAGTLSGGEAQRIRLATQIGSALTGVLYVLDEPSIGLHQRDNDRLIDTLKKMRDLDNTLIVVEHDEDTMLAADWLIDIGPGAGEHGGQVVASGTPEEVMNNDRSITGRYLSGKEIIPVPAERRKPDKRFIEVKGAKENNLKNVNVKIPIGLFNVVTGVSGSGKSTLVNEIIYKAISRELYNSKLVQGNSGK